MLASFHTAHPFVAIFHYAITQRVYSMPVDSAPVPKVNKVWDNIDKAIKAVNSGNTLLSGGALLSPG